MSEINTTFNNKAVGKSGTSISGGVYDAEYLTELIGILGQDKYERMDRSDPQVRKIHTAITAPIKAAKWSVEPSSMEEIDIKAAALMEQIFFKDMDFVKKLGEFLKFIPRGFSMFEIVHVNKEDSVIGQYTGLAGLRSRRQSTITEWKHDANTGDLLEVHQEQSGDIEVNAWLSTDILLIFYNEQEGDDNGFPINRVLYGPYKRKLLIETLKMIGIERSAIPTPTLKVPASIDVNDEEYKSAVSILESFTSAESSFITFPDGWELNLMPNGGFDPMKLEDSIKREDEKMVGTILATFLELGTGGNSGAFALGENLQKFFTQVLESFAQIIKGTINRDLIPSLVKMNFGDAVKVMPTLEFSGITEEAGKEFMEILTGFTGSGIVGVDEALEDHVRKLFNLPKKVEGTILENGEKDGENDNANDGGVDDADSDDDADGGSGEDIELKLSMKFAEAKTPKSLIDQQSIPTLDIMQRNITTIGEKLIADISRNYKQLSDGQKLKAVDGIKLGGVAIFKKQLKGVLNTTANKSLDMVEKETGITDVKLQENIEVSKILEKYKTVKLADDGKLPKHAKKLVQVQANLLAEKMASDLEDAVVLAYIQTEQTTGDLAVLQEEMNGALKAYEEGRTVNTASITSTSTIVNQTRNEFFFTPEVLEQIYAFKFINTDPKSLICDKLSNQGSGRVFAKNDTKFFIYSPPLHFNCKSYLSAILVSQKSLPDIQKLPSLSTADRKSATLRFNEDKSKGASLEELIDNLVNLKHN